MKQSVFTGSAVAIVTPFKQQSVEQVDYAKLAEFIDWQIAAGTSAIVVAGTTGEASTMPDAEHIELIRQAVLMTKKRVPLIAGVGSNDTAHALNLAKAAELAGADALLTVTPYYNKASQEGLYQHFSATAKAVSVPIILYNVPSRTQCNIAPTTYQRLAKHENIVGVKECNFSQLADTMNLCGDALAYYSGEDGLALPLMALGGQGVISVLANIVPEKIAQMCALFSAGQLQAAAQAQVALSPLIQAMFCEVNPMPVKAALQLMGKEPGPCRLPLCELAPQNLEYIRKVLGDYKLL